MMGFMTNWPYKLLILRRRGDGLIHILDKGRRVKNKVSKVEELKTGKCGIIPMLDVNSITASQMAILYEYRPGQFTQIDVNDALKLVDKNVLEAAAGKVFKDGVKLTNMSETERDFLTRGTMESVMRFKKKGWLETYLPILMIIACMLVFFGAGVWWWSPMNASMGQVAKAMEATAVMERANFLMFNKSMSEYGAMVKYANGTMTIIPLKGVEQGAWKGG